MRDDRVFLRVCKAHFFVSFIFSFFNTLMLFLHKKKNKVMMDYINGKDDHDTSC